MTELAERKENQLVTKNPPNFDESSEIIKNPPFVKPDAKVLARCIPNLEIVIHPTFSKQELREGVGKQSGKAYKFIQVDCFARFPNQHGSAERVTFNVSEVLKAGTYMLLDSAWSTRLDYNRPVISFDIKNENLVMIEEAK